MKSLFSLLLNLLLFNLFVYSQTPAPLLQVDAIAASNSVTTKCYECHLDTLVSEASNDFFRIQNGTHEANPLIALIRSHYESDSPHTMQNLARTYSLNNVVKACTGGYQNTILIIGQSNSGTLGSINDLTENFDNKANFLKLVSNTTGTNPVGMTSSTVSGSGRSHGIELPLAYYLQPIYKNLHIVRYGIGGKGLFQNKNEIDWNVNSSGEILDNFKKFWNKYKSNVSCNVKVRKIIWVQGENDSNNDILANQYAANLYDLIFYIYDLLGQDPEWINVRVNINVIDKPYSALQLVREAHENIGDSFINTDDINLSSDGIHYDSSGYVEIANRIRNLIFTNQLK